MFGINVEKFSIDYAKIVERVNKMINDSSNNIKREIANLDPPKLFSSECNFVDFKTISLKNVQEHITEETMPPIRGLRESGYITSNEALRIGPKFTTSFLLY